jgi:hypothetical protein
MFKSRKSRSVANLVPGCQDTPFPIKGPSALGKAYLSKFNDYLTG